MIVTFTDADLAGGKHLGAGDHNCRITKLERKGNKKGTGDNLEVEFTSAAELTTRDWFPLAAGVNFKLGKLALACGFTSDELKSGKWDTAQLANCYVRVVREVTGEESYTDKDGKQATRKNYANSYLPSPNAKPSTSHDDSIPF